MGGPRVAISVLLVDDEPAVLRALARMFAPHFDAVEVASDAQMAFERCCQRRFRTLVTDFNMPHRDGLWLLAQLRRYDPGVHRILISGGCPPSLEQHLRSGLVQHFVAKPIAVQEVSAIRRWAPRDHGAQPGLG